MRSSFLEPPPHLFPSEQLPQYSSYDSFIPMSPSKANKLRRTPSPSTPQWPAPTLPNFRVKPPPRTASLEHYDMQDWRSDLKALEDYFHVEDVRRQGQDPLRDLRTMTPSLRYS